MLIPILSLTFGLIILLKGADWLVGSASALARSLNIPDLAIGLTIVAFGTSAPELVVNIFASLDNHQDVVLGNVIGSDIFNLFAILGMAGLITPLAVKSSTVWKEIPLSIISVVLLYLLCNDFFSAYKVITRLDGIILFSFFILFLFLVHRQIQRDAVQVELAKKNLSTAKTWGFMIIGLAGLIIGGKLVVVNAIHIATHLGLSEKIIGLTIVAAGTSLPEMATSLVAAHKKNIDIAVGNIVGSNIFNILFILPVSCLIRPIAYDIHFNPEIYLLAGGATFLFISMFTFRKNMLDRWEAGILLFTFLAYTVYLVGKET